MRDDRLRRPEPPAAAYFYSPDRSGAYAETWLGDFLGIVQADAFPGSVGCTNPARKPGPAARGGLLGACPTQVLRAGRAQEGAPIAIEAVARIDAIFATERAHQRFSCRR